MRSYETALLVIGATPFMILVAAGLLVGAGTLFKLLGPDSIKQLVFLGVGLWLFVMLVLLLITNVCGRIRPQELFADGDGSATAKDPYHVLIRDITLAETDVCLLMTRTDQFVIGAVSTPGKDNRSAAVSAIEAARTPTGGVMTLCPSTWPKDLTDHDAVLGEAANRLARMESTLKNYTEPELLRTYKQVVPCESFATDDNGAEEQRLTVLGQLRDRLDAINATITAQKKNLLRPIDNKQKDLKAGKVSDCEKSRGAALMAKNASTASMLAS